jgi:hypothetical protein
MRLFSSGHIVLSCVVWTRHPHLFIGVEWSVGDRIFGDPHATRLGGATRRHHMEGGGSRCMQGCQRTMGAVASRCCLPATTFRMVVACWAWTPPRLVWGPSLQGKWAFFLFVCVESMFTFLWLRTLTLFSCIPSVYPENDQFTKTHGIR